MKKATIARFVIGLAAISAVGCSAETGASGEGIGSTSEALTGTPVKLGSAPTSLTANQSPLQEREFGSSCYVKDATSGAEYMIIAGGFSSSGTAKSDIILSQVGGAWTTQAATLSVARGDGKLIKISDSQCVFVGGTTSPSGATAQATVDLLTLVHGSPDTVSVNSGVTPHALNLARSNFEISTCTDNNSALHLVVFGGFKSGASPAELSDIEVSPAVSSLGSAWTQYTSKLRKGRYNFGLAKDKNGERYVAAGGSVTGAVRDNTIDLITMSTSCVPTSTAPATNLSASVDGNVAFYEGTTDTFIVAAGRYVNITTQLWPSADKLTVTWTGTPSVAVTAASAPSAGTFRPVLIETDPTGKAAHALAGGANAAISAAVATVQEYYSGAWHAAATGLSPATAGAVGEYFPIADEFLTATGRDFSTPLPLAVQGYTP